MISKRDLFISGLTLKWFYGNLVISLKFEYMIGRPALTESILSLGNTYQNSDLLKQSIVRKLKSLETSYHKVRSNRQKTKG